MKRRFLADNIATLIKAVGGTGVLVGSGIVTTAQGYGHKLGPYEAPASYAGAAIATLGLILLALGYLSSWLSARFGSRLDRFRARCLNSRELVTLQSVMEKYTPGEVTAVSEKEQFLAINPSLYFAVERIEPGEQPALKGYYAVYPLKKAAVDALERGDRNTWYGNTPGADNLTKERGRAAGFHIGYIWGEGREGSAAVIRLLLEDLAKRCRKHGTFRLFTRPMTSDGLRLTKRYGFRQVVTDRPPELRRICYLFADPADYL